MVIRGFQDNGITTIEDLRLALELLLRDAFAGIGASVDECHAIGTIEVRVSRACEEGDLFARITLREISERERAERYDRRHAADRPSA